MFRRGSVTHKLIKAFEKKGLTSKEKERFNMYLLCAHLPYSAPWVIQLLLQ